MDQATTESFFQEFMHPRTIDEVLAALLESTLLMVILERIDFGEHVEDVEAVAVHAFFQPEIEDIDDLLADLRVFPVEVCLFLRKEVEIELIGIADPLPCASGKGGFPVAGRKELVLFPSARADDVIIPVRGIRSGFDNL